MLRWSRNYHLGLHLSELQGGIYELNTSIAPTHPTSVLFGWLEVGGGGGAEWRMEGGAGKNGGR